MSSPPPPGPERSEPGGSPESWPGQQPRPRVRPVAPLSDPLVPPDLRGWVDRIRGVLRRSLVPLAAIQLAVAVVGALLSFALPPVQANGSGPSEVASGLAALGLTFALVVGVFAQGTSVYVAIQDAAGRPLTAREALRFAAERAPMLVGWGMVAVLLTMAGCFMLLVPGLYLAIVFGASLSGVVIVERRTLVRCFELVNPRFWPTAERMALAAAAGVVYTVVAEYVVRALTAPGSFPEALLRAAVQVPLGMAMVALAVVTYAELRFHERGEVFTATLAAELER